MIPNHKALCEALDAAAPDWRELSYPDEADMLTNAARAIRALIAERDAAMAWFRAVEKTGSALCQTFDLATPAEEALRDVLTTACSLAEFEAFRAGAEAMREAAAKLHDEAAAKLAGGRKRINQFEQHIINVLERKAQEIRALPIGDST